MGVGGLHPAAANRGAYAVVVQGIASHPKAMPQPRPAARGPKQPHPPNTRDAFTKALGAIFPTLDMKGTVWCLWSSIDLMKRYRVDLAKLPPLPLERR